MEPPTYYTDPDRVRFIYPRLVGGPLDKKKAPAVPRQEMRVQYAEQPTTSCFMSEGEGPPPSALRFTTHSYLRHKVAFGRSRIMDFFAHEELAGEDAAEALFDAMLSRCGARRVVDF